MIDHDLTLGSSTRGKFFLLFKCLLFGGIQLFHCRASLLLCVAESLPYISKPAGVIFPQETILAQNINPIVSIV